MILIVGQNTAWQKVCVLPRLTLGGVNRVEEVLQYASSKGPNVARALGCVGQPGLVLGYAGGRTGKLLSEGLQAEGIRADLTPIRGETRLCTTFAARNGQSTEVIEPSPEVTAEERSLFMRIFTRHIAEARLLFICGTAVRGESHGCYSLMVAEARRHGVCVLLDSACAEAVQALTQSPQILKVNAAELSQIASRPAGDPARRVEIYRGLARRYGVKWFFTTMGSEGMEGFDGTRLLHAAPPRIHVINAIGSGDAASAGIGWTLLEEQASGSLEAAFGSRACFERALLNGTAMGTANCLNPKNGWVESADLASIQAKVLIREVPLP
jgi:tagatose 6-phosphate kinase